MPCPVSPASWILLYGLFGHLASSNSNPMQRILGGNYGPLYLTVCGKPNNLTIMAPVFMYTESSLRAMEGNCLRLNEFWKDSLIQAEYCII